MLFNDKGRFDWKTFPDMVEMPGDLQKFIDADCLCGVIKVYEFRNGESFKTCSQPFELGSVTSLCEIKNLVDPKEFNLQTICRGFEYGHYLLYIEDKLTPKERLLNEYR